MYATLIETTLNVTYHNPAVRLAGNQIDRLEIQHGPSMFKRVALQLVVVVVTDVTRGVRASIQSRNRSDRAYTRWVHRWQTEKQLLSFAFLLQAGRFGAGLIEPYVALAEQYHHLSCIRCKWKRRISIAIEARERYRRAAVGTMYRSRPLRPAIKRTPYLTPNPVVAVCREGERCCGPPIQQSFSRKVAFGSENNRLEQQEAASKTALSRAGIPSLFYAHLTPISTHPHSCQSHVEEPSKSSSHWPPGRWNFASFSTSVKCAKTNEGIARPLHIMIEAIDGRCIYMWRLVREGLGYVDMSYLSITPDESWKNR